METEQTTGTGRHGLAAVLARWLIEAETNLRAWTENPPGYLVPTEPDPEQRALVRIGLRAQIHTLCKALDEQAPASAEADNHRDLQRIRDAVGADMVCPSCGRPPVREGRAS